MTMPDILLIDDNKDRAQQVEVVLQFLECRCSWQESKSVATAWEDDVDFDAIFVGATTDKLASLLKSIHDKVNDVPIALLVDKTAPPLSSATKIIS